MADTLYDKFKEKLMAKEIDMINDTIKLSLVKNTYNFTATDEFLDDVGTGNLAGGSAAAQTIAGTKTITNGVFDSTDVIETFTSINDGTVNALLVWKDTGDTATSPVIAYIDSPVELPFATNGGDVNFNLHTSGYFKL